MTNPSTDPLIGSTVREYEILDLIHKDSFGSVYLARHVLLDEERAITMIRTELANDQQYRDRFIRQAKVFTKLRHRNLVQLFEFGTLDEKTFFMVFELIRGETVLQRIRRLGKIPPADSIRILREASLGLQMAHQQKIVHQNISADSLILVQSETGEEITKVVDFGLARPTIEETTKYRIDTTAVAKLEYAGTEVFASGMQVDHRLDIYSLGVVLYYMLAGRLPFTASSPANYMMKHLHDMPEPINDVHPLLSRIVLKAMSKNRDDRHSSMEQFIADLDRIPAGDSVATTQITGPGADLTKDLQPGVIYARRYRIDSRIGKGGMGTVYKAVDNILDVAVALKTINRDITDNERTVQRLKREVILARKVAHPNACRIYDIGETDGTHYVSMEYVEGRTLADILQDQGRLTPEEGIPVLRQLLSALQEAHRVGIIHRDLKPQNIMVDISDRAFIMDFGISVSEEVNRLTETGMMIGTPRYMAPEQFGNRSVDQRSDIYAMGIIMFEMFTGRLPFDANTPASVMFAHLHGTLLKPTQVVNTIPSDLEAIILKAMEKEPQSRYQTITEVLRDLATIDTGKLSTASKTVVLTPKKATPSEAVEQPTIPADRSLPKSVWGVIATVIVIGIGVFAFLATRSSENKSPTAGTETQAVVEPAGPPITVEPKPSIPVTTTPPAPVMRSVRLETSPAGAEIFVDGKTTGKSTPSSVSVASDAEMKVELRFSGYESSSITIDNASPETISTVLKQLVTQGTIIYEGAYPVAVYNGNALLMNTAQTKSIQLKEGKYTLTLISSERALIRQTQTIELKAGTTVPLTIPPMASLSILAQPSRCKITIDGVYKDEPPVTNLPIQAGSHEVLIEWPGLDENKTVSVDLTENQKKRMFATKDSVEIVEEP